MMSSFAEFAYKSAETAFKKTTGNKKTMTAVASKGRWLFLSACLVAAATADDASLRGPSLGRDVALAPQDPGHFPEHALASDGGAPPDDAAGEEGPPASRRLQVTSDGDGWTKYRGKFLPGHNTLTLNGGEGGGDVDHCKALCISFLWCVNFEVTTVHHAEGATKCSLSNHEADEDDLAPSRGWNLGYDHYRLDRTQLTQPAWTKHEGKFLPRHNTLTLDGEGGGDVDHCKALCVRFEWCVNFDVMINSRKCFLSDHEAGGDALATSSWFDHYTLDRVQYLNYNARQDVCESIRVGGLTDSALAVLPSCDVSEWRSFDNMFSLFGSGHGSSFNADLSRWDVNSGTSFNNMFNRANEFDQDLSRWNIHHIQSNGGYPAVDGMFERSGMTDVNKCPCIEWASLWRRWCPGATPLEVPGNPTEFLHAYQSDNYNDLICVPTTRPGRL